MTSKAINLFRDALNFVDQNSDQILHVLVVDSSLGLVHGWLLLIFGGLVLLLVVNLAQILNLR